MLIFTKKNGVTLPLRDGHSHNFLLESTVPEGVSGALLAPERKKILIFAPNVRFFGHVYAGFRHGFKTILCFHQWLVESQADLRIFHFHVARVGRVSLRDKERLSR